MDWSVCLHACVQVNVCAYVCVCVYTHICVCGEGGGKKKIFIKTVESLKHEIAPSFFTSHRGKKLLSSSDKKRD